MANRSAQNNNQITQLNASGSREVVYCHECGQEWYHDDYGLECPQCEGTITEIVVPGPDDPRSVHNHETPSFLRHYHEPWIEDASDLTETNNSSTFSTMQNTSSRTTDDSQNARDEASSNETGHVLSDFRNIISNLFGPQLRHSVPGRSGPETLFDEPRIQTTSIRLGGSGNRNSIIGGRIIFTNTFTHEPQLGGVPEFDDIASYASPFFSYPQNIQPLRYLAESFLTINASILSNVIASSFGSRNTSPFDGTNTNPGPVGLQALFSAFFAPRNARFGDAVYSEEALDQILTTLMEQTQVSNAPGPASPEAIASLPRKKLDSKLLGSEEKGECSVCMDDIKIGDEVVVLPCNHWFDESCVTSWLKEHNTCPICRKGISNDGSSCLSNTEGGQTNPSNSRNENRPQMAGTSHSRLSREAGTRNQERLDYLRNAAGVNLSEEVTQQPACPQDRDDRAANMPGSFPRDFTDHSESRNLDSPRASRTTSNSGNSGNVGRSGTFSRLREFHDRLSNSRRHD